MVWMLIMGFIILAIWQAAGDDSLSLRARWGNTLLAMMKEVLRDGYGSDDDLEEIDI